MAAGILHKPLSYRALPDVIVTGTIPLADNVADRISCIQRSSVSAARRIAGRPRPTWLRGPRRSRCLFRPKGALFAWASRRHKSYAQAAPSTYGGGQTWVSRHPRRGPPSPSARGWRESGPRPFPGRSPRLSGAGRIRSRERLCTRVGVRERRGKRHRSRVCDDRIGGLEPGRENHSCRACASTPLLIEAAWSRMTDRRESMPSCQLNRRA